MHRPARAPDRTTLMIAGDDAEAKRTAGEFLDRIGYDVFDTGSLATVGDSSATSPPPSTRTSRTASSATRNRPTVAHLQALLDRANPSIH